MNVLYYGEELYHHGIKGQKWGIRKYQNADGSLTPAGKKRYDVMTNASNAATKIAKYYRARESAERKGFEEDVKAAQARAKKSGDKKFQEKFLNEEFGNDWKDKKYFKDLTGYDDPHKYAKDELSYVPKDNSRVAYNKRDAEKYEALAKKFKNIPIDKVDRKTMKEAKALIKELQPTLLDRAFGITADMKWRVDEER